MKLDEINLPRRLDKRVKLTEADKKEIKQLHKEGMSIRAITRKVGKVSRRAIQFVLFPERLEQAKVNRDWAKYYDKEKRKVAQRKHRQSKRQRLIKSKIIKMVCQNCSKPIPDATRITVKFCSDYCQDVKYRKDNREKINLYNRLRRRKLKS